MTKNILFLTALEKTYEISYVSQSVTLILVINYYNHLS
jgi:hypothetical protein